MHYDLDRALELLRKGADDPSAVFRDGQDAAIGRVVEGRGRLLVVQKTGWGKSFVYFIATALLREAGYGPALLVSPLLALMRNQITAAERMGVRAETINSDNNEDWDAIERQVTADEIDILLISPERLANERFAARVLGDVAGRISLLVIDEAHCISDWGHDFRPKYRLLQRTVSTLPRNVRLLATTATANNRVMTDLVDVLGPDLEVSHGDLTRRSLTLQTIRLPKQEERLAWLADQLERLDGHGIIYTLTVRDAHLVTAWLKSREFAVEAYSGQSDGRESLEHALLHNDLKALVATTALGMGFDKPDLAFVIHYQMPGSVVAYYQQVGRAGRALESAYGVLLSGEEEDEINEWFIGSAFPSREEAAQVLDALEAAPDGMTVTALLSRLNMKRGRLEKTLDLLALESPAPVVREDKTWQLTAAPLGEAFWERTERLTSLRREERDQMKAYAALPFGEHMAFLIEALDGDSTEVPVPLLSPLPEAVDPRTVHDAITFLRRRHLPIEPRKRWDNAGLPSYGLKGKIPIELQAQPGRALALWGDAGWGRAVIRGKYQESRFSEELAVATAEMVREWDPQPAPEWVTAIPSLRRPELIPSFARQIAARLDLPFESALIKTKDRPEQKTMENGTQQARNVDGAFAIDPDRTLSGPVLLVDDMVDSRWTMTVAAWLLLDNGCDRVWPVALAQAGS